MQLARNMLSKFDYYLIEKGRTEDRLGVYKLWYEVYCKEMKRDLDFADHNNMTLVDRLEPHSYLLTAKGVNGDIVGSIRINFPEDEYVSYYKELYELCNFKHGEVGFATRYMVHSNYRGNYISHELMDSAIGFLEKRNKKVLIVDCSPPVYKLFDKLGFTDYLGEKYSERYGKVKIMKFDIAEKHQPDRKLRPVYIKKEERNEKARSQI